MRHDKAERTSPPPTYAYALLGKDVKRIWYMMATFVDRTIDALLLERLKATTIDEATWEQAVASSQKHGHGDVRRIQNAIRGTEDAQRGIIENLKTITHPDLVQQLQETYIANEHELERLHAELSHAQTDRGHRRLLSEARLVLEMVLARWDEVAREDRRELFEAFAERVVVNRPDFITRTIGVVWRDGTETTRTMHRESRYQFAWSEAEYTRLRKMVESGADQVALLRAFPGASWRTLRELFAYHFGSEAWRAVYKGRKSKYGARVRWDQTDEYRSTLNDTENAASAVGS